MIRVNIDETEWYPVMSYEREGSILFVPRGAVDVPEEVLARYDAAEKAMNAAFEELNSYRKR